MKQYKAKRGARISNQKIRRYANYLAALERKHKYLSAGIVVQAARKKSSPLHDYFEWDDTAAARQYRMVQARELLRKIEVVIVDPSSGKEHNIRAWVHLQSVSRDEEGVYRGINNVLSHDQLRRQMLDEAVEELSWFRRKYAILKELAAVFDVIDRLNRRGRKRGKRGK